MNPVRGGLPAALTLSVVAAATTWAAMLSWRGFTEQSVKFLGPLLVLGAVVAVSGAFGRWSRLSPWVVVPGQVVLSGAVASMMLCGSPVPVGPAWDRLVTSFSDAVASAEQYQAPVPSFAPGVEPLLIGGGLVCLLLVDLIACTLRRAPLAGLPLLVVYTVPVSLAIGGVSWWVFGLTAAGYLTLLFLQESEQVARWGRPLGSDKASDPFGFGVRTGVVRTTAGTVGGAATALAIFLPILIPTLDLNVLPGGRGGGGDEISIENPMVDLRRDLRRGEDLPLVRVQTDDPSPSYLRISVLNRYSDDEWTPDDRDVPAEQRAAGQLPELVGVSSQVARTEYDYDVTVSSNFESTWLPTQAPITSIEAEGDWRYDLSTMDFLAGEDDLTTAGTSYRMTGVKLELSGVAMSRAAATNGLVSSDYLELPDGIPSEVSNLAFQVTRNEESRFEQAVALQQWFREDGGFQYDIRADQGNGTDDLLRFLSTNDGGRTGYCEQFAAAMAVMGRTLGIPSRVAIGFLKPDQVAPDTYEYSAYDLHAWPEMFFPGSGWVRFEPTPPGRASNVPAYTAERIPDVVNPTGPVLPRDSGLPERGESESASASPEAEQEAAATDEGGSIPWLPIAGGTAGLLVLAGLALAPRLVRERRRRARLVGQPEQLWLELRDTAVDLGIPWPVDRSPRETGDHLAQYVGLPLTERTPERPARGAHLSPTAIAALDRLVLALERLRYARTAPEPDPALVADLETCRASLAGGSPRRDRRRAEWWPRSVLRRAPRSRSLPGTASVPIRAGGVVDHVG